MPMYTLVANAFGVWTAVPTSTGGFSGPLEIQVVATAGTTAALGDVLQAFPAAPN
jgi:hypothetical protein